MSRPQIKGLAIRDDGMLYPATPRVLAQSNFRPYHGDPKASLEERLDYLSGNFGVDKKKIEIAQGKFDLNAASKEELLDFAMDEYGVKLDARKNIIHIREEVKRLATQHA